MGIHTVEMTPPALQDGHVRVYVDINVEPIRQEFQRRLDDQVALIPAGRNRDLKIEEAADENRLQYMDRIMAAALGQMQEDRERANRRLNGDDIDKKIAEKEKEIEKLEAEKLRNTALEDKVASDIAPA